MDPKIIKKTQDTLGKAIKKPPLTEKLLNKPPFRFLHDIITEVIKNTGVLNGLFSEEELNSANVTDKEAKMNFLQKAIDCVGIVIGELLTVRPSKIVAGHEPEKTNEFLQHLGKICLKKVDTTSSVQKTLAGEKPGRKKAREPKESKGKSSKDDDDGEIKRDKRVSKDDKDRKSRESSGSSRQKDEPKEKKVSSKDQEGSSKDRVGSSKDQEGSSRDQESVSKDREGSSKEREGSSKERSSTRDREGSSKERVKDRNGSSKDRGAAKESSRSKEERLKEREKKDEKLDSYKKEKEDSEGREAKSNPADDYALNDRRETSNERIGSSKERKAHNVEKERDRPRDDESKNAEQIADADDVPKTLQRPASAKGQRRRPSSHTGSGSDDEDQQDKEKVDDIANQMDARKMSSIRRPSSARPAPPRIKKQQVKEEQPRINSGKAVPPVIVDNKKNIDEDDDDTFIVEEDPTLQDMLEVKASDSNPDFINTEEHGSLVRKMLESKKEADARQGSQITENKPVIFDAARRKEREVAEKEMEKLRNSIQLLVRSAHPLGKIMDYVQEDIDSMRKELNMWKEENKRHEQALKAEQSVTENEVAPLQALLTELEREIAQVIDSISVVKSNILRNEEKVEELVVGVSMS